jgi:signal transduction histidine kinase
VKLKTQFAILTGAVTLFPILLGLIFFGIQQGPRDPREPTGKFLQNLLLDWKSGMPVTGADLQVAAEKAGLPLREAALLAPDGTVISSTFERLKSGEKIDLNDIARPPRPSAGNPRPELKLMPIDYRNSASPLVLFDAQLFWTRQDIKNRNIFLVGSFAFGLFVVSSILSLLILRSIGKSINDLESDTAIVATGNLDHEVAGSGNHEILSLAKSINLMRLNLKDMLTRRSKMLMGISHDLKTPIALIQGYADALADNVASDESTRAQYLDIIRNKTKQLEDLTSELIDFLKIGGDGSISVEIVDVKEMLNTLGKRFSDDAALLDKKFNYGFGEKAEAESSFEVPHVAMNRLLVERAIENLVGNAFRYTGSGGSVSLLLLVRGDALAFSVIDNGAGITEADAPYVFDAFYRGSHSRSDGGHGFGLTIVKAVADLHGWRVAVGKRSDGAQGTQADFWLNVAKDKGKGQEIGKRLA